MEYAIAIQVIVFLGGTYRFVSRPGERVMVGSISNTVSGEDG